MHLARQQCTPVRGPVPTGQASEQATESACCPSTCMLGLLGCPALPCLLRAQAQRLLPGSEAQRCLQGELQAWTSTWPQLQAQEHT